MKIDRATHHRHSLRLPGYDYANAGAYFVTVCTQNRACLFGDVVNGQMILNVAGRMIERWFRQLPNKFAGVGCDAFVCMRNHVHFVVAINSVATKPVGADPCVRPDDPRKGAHAGAPLRDAIFGGSDAHPGAPLWDATSADVDLPTTAQWFKTMTTNEYIRGVKSLGWPAFSRRLWQRNYYEHIVRTEDSLARIREYIRDNPAKWTLDRENPVKAGLAATRTEQEDSP